MKSSRLASILRSIPPMNQNISNKNTFMASSTSTEELFKEYGELKNVTLQDGKVVVEQIVNEIFVNKVGSANLSSSQPSLTDLFSESEDMDKRLKVWQDTLRDREKMQEKINRKIGKSPNEMLFNLPASVEQRDKGTVQRLMDIANRMNPTNLSQQKPATLKEYLHPEECVCVPRLQETLPKLEVEINGLTKTTKTEILANKNQLHTPKSRKHTKWENSKVLEKRIHEKTADIKRVLEYCPDIDNLEVIGNNLLEFGLDHNDEINLVTEDSLVSISSTTSSEPMPEQHVVEHSHQALAVPMVEYSHQSLAVPMQEQVNIGVKINDIIYIMEQKRTHPFREMHVNFECEPYQRERKEVVRFENIGKKIVICEWLCQDIFKRHTVWAASTDCFLFDCRKFILFPGDVHITSAVFQPRVVCVRRQRWELRIFPNFLSLRRPSLIIHLNGKCSANALYVNKINKLMDLVSNKAKGQTQKQVLRRQAELVPIIEPPHLCPYQRPFDEREIFNAQNMGYHCDRFADIEGLRALYNTVKLPREPPWDLCLASIRKVIIRLPDAAQRQSFFQMLLDIQNTMFCGGDDQLVRFEHGSEREKSRLIYVKGCIGNGIEVWEQLMSSIEKIALRSELIRFRDKSGKSQHHSQNSFQDQEETDPWLRHLKSSNPNLYALKKLRSNKFYRDSFYILTYNQLCDIAENIVSVIESTDYI